MYGEEEKCIQGFDDKPEGRSRNRWKENIIIDVKVMT
jgi:hypothetical protein